MLEKITNLLQPVKEGFGVYIATQPDVFNNLTVSEELKPHIRFIDCLLAENSDWYKVKVSEFNTRVFGKQGMPTEAWVDAHFGIGAGVTLGYADASGDPISMMRFTGSINEGHIQEFTLLVDPKYGGIGFGKATLGLGCAVSQNKEKLNFITQLDNNAIALYLRLTYGGKRIYLKGIGFHHAHPHSIYCEADMPKDPNTIFQSYEMPPIKDGIPLADGIELTKGNGYLIKASNLPSIIAVSKDLGTGAQYSVIGWYDADTAKALGVAEPLTMIEKLR